MRVLVVAVLTTLVSCGIINESNDTRICIDWDSRVVIREKCIPMYGTLICADEEKVETWCVLYEELIDTEGRPDAKRET
ncbi:hypothetical protein YFHUAIHA_CDS0073 [Phage C48C1]|nr:hypothetical protein YFHUAIHA_CDS0073 [Phage C48C1]